MSSALACKRQNLYETRGSPTRRSERVSWTIPAVVVGAGEGGLGIVRSLGTRGVPVIVVDDDSRHLAMHSRYAYPFKVGGTSGQDLIEGLLALRAQLSESPVLFLTLDDQVEAVSRDRAQLDTAFRLRLPDHDLICQLLHKSSFQAMAERHQFPVPRSVVVRNNADLSSLAVLRFPAVIKPGTKSLTTNTTEGGGLSI